MTALDLVARIRSLGGELVVRDGELRIRKPRNAPLELETLLAEVRREREAIRAALLTPPPVCVECESPVPEIDLFCPGCFERRRSVPADEIARRREARRQRTEQRLQARPCESCGAVDWAINFRGDAFCRSCFEKEPSSWPNVQ